MLRDGLISDEVLAAMVIEGVPDERVIYQAVAVVQALPEGEALVAVQTCPAGSNWKPLGSQAYRRSSAASRPPQLHSTGSQPFVDSLSPATGTLSVTLS